MTNDLRAFLNTHKPKSTPGIFALARQHLPPHGVAYDLCCGSGQFTQQMRDAGLRAYGFDLADAFIGTEAAQRSGFVVADAARVPAPSASADVVVCIDSLQYFADPGAALQEMARLLRPGGRLVFSTQNNSNPAGIKRRLMEALTGRTWSPWLAHPVENHLTYGQLMRLLDDAGLRVEYVRGQQFLTAWVALLPSFVRHWQPFPGKPWRTLAGMAARARLPRPIEESALRRFAMMLLVRAVKKS